MGQAPEMASSSVKARFPYMGTGLYRLILSVLIKHGKRDWRQPAEGASVHSPKKSSGSLSLIQALICEGLKPAAGQVSVAALR